MAGGDTADTTKDLKEALWRSRTLHISFPPPYGFRQREGGSKVSDLPGIKHESEDIIHGMQHLGKLRIQSWRSMEGKTSLLLSSHSLPIIEVIFSLSRFCKEVQHLMIDVYSFNVSRLSISKFSSSGMESVQTVSLSCMAGSLVLEDALAFSAGCFPNLSTLKVSGRIILKSSSVSKVQLTLDLKELVLTLGKNLTLSLDNLLNTVSAACRKLKRFHIYSDRKFPFHTLPKMISQLACPELELLKLSQAKISLDKIVALEGVSWQKSSERCELILDKASAELPLMDVVHVVSRELKGVTVLSLNECDVKLPGKIDVPEQKLREDTSIREINLFNMKDPIPENDMQALFTINVTLRDPSPHDGADMVHKYRSADEKSVEMPPLAKKRAHPSLAPMEPKRVRKLELDPEGKLDKEQTSTSTLRGILKRRQLRQESGLKPFKEQSSTSTPLDILTRLQEELSQKKKILAGYTARKAPVEPKRVRKLQLDPEGKLEKEQTSTSTPSRRVLKRAKKREMTSQGTQTPRIPSSFTEGKGKPLVKECHKKIGAEGGKIQLDSFGIELQIPRGAVDTKAPVDIALRVLTDSPTNLNNNKDEVLTCFGVQCLAPDDLVLKKPVTFLIPHCAELHRLTSHSIRVVMYTGDGEYTEDADAKERILLSDKGMPRCVIEKKLLRLTVDHFSWRFFKFIWRNIGFKGKKLYCIPFVEQNIPEKPEDIILHVYLCDAIKGNIKLIKAEELELGYVPAHTKTEVLIRWAETDLKLQCCVNSSTQTKSLSYDRISGSPRNCVSFVSKYKSKRDIVSLTVGQEGVNPEILFRIDVGDHQIAKQGTSKASSSSSGNTVRQRQAVNDQQIAKLAELLSSNAYSMLCRKLGIKYNSSCQILEKHRGNCKAAYMEVLHQWKDKTGGPIKSLDKALDSCNVGGLISEYKE